MLKPATRRRIVVCALAAVAATAFLVVRGISVGDVIGFATDKAARAASDTRALFNGETTERVAREMKSQAARISAAAEAAREGQPTELERELAAERQRVLEARAEALQKNAGKVLEGDLEGLKRQIREQARQAGGPEQGIP